MIRPPNQKGNFHYCWAFTLSAIIECVMGYAADNARGNIAFVQPATSAIPMPCGDVKPQRAAANRLGKIVLEVVILLLPLKAPASGFNLN
jgi:hypothetical protein